MASTINVPTPGADGVVRTKLGKKRCEICECYLVSGERDAAAVAEDSKLLDVDVISFNDTWFHGQCYDAHWRKQRKQARTLISYSSLRGADDAFKRTAQRVYEASVLSLCDVKRRLEVFPCPGITDKKNTSGRNVFESFKLELSPSLPLRHEETRTALRFGHTLPFCTKSTDPLLHAQFLPSAQQYFSFVLNERIHCDIKDADAMLEALKVWRNNTPLDVSYGTRVFAHVGRIKHSVDADSTATTIEFYALFTPLQNDAELNRLAQLWMLGEHSLAHTAVSRDPTSITKRFLNTKTRMLLPLPSEDGAEDDPADTDHEQLSCVHSYLIQMNAFLAATKRTHNISYDYAIEPIVRSVAVGNELSVFANARVQLLPADYVFVCTVDEKGIIETARLATVSTNVPGTHAPWLIPEISSEFTTRVEKEYRCEIGVPSAS